MILKFNIIREERTSQLVHCLVFFAAWSAPDLEWLTTLRADIEADSTLKAMLQKCHNNTQEDSNYTSQNGILLWRNRVVIPPKSDLVKLILKEFHDSKVGGHSGIAKTME
ncbi:hypothetical protein S83_038619 [Arachis hypogaea]